MSKVSAQPLPLVIDLDGTLVRSDLLIESSLEFLRANPLKLFLALFWLFSSKAKLKEKLAQAIAIDAAQLPYHEEVINLIKTAKAQGRPVILATASHKIYADKVAAHLQLFDQVLATDGQTNLSAKTKRNKLVQLYGEGGFDYVGNSHDDIAIWQAARKAYVIEPEAGVTRRAKALGNVEQIIQEKNSRFKLWARALRLHQWAKNSLIFVPLLASHQLNALPLLAQGLLAFFCFGLCASSVYLMNDLFDLSDDRHHVKKRYRPFASGQLSIKAGMLVCPILLVLAFTGAFLFLPPLFTASMAVYYLLTLAYSISLKRRMVVDVITLAALYTLRIVAGTFVFMLPLTFWMLAFSMFIFLSLALIKRYAELLAAKKAGRMEKTPGRGYFPTDLEMIASLGAASGYLSVMVLALYIQDSNTITLYNYPQIIWLACPLLLFWVTRMWLLAHRGQMNEDPVVFALKDKLSLIICVLFAAIFWIAK